MRRWTTELVDLSRRNNLLYFKDLKTGTLDLSSADRARLSELLGGSKVRASRLFPEREDFEASRGKLKEIRRRVRSLAAERGIDTGHLAAGTVSWMEPQGSGPPKPTRAPLILRRVSITSRGQKAADFELELEESAELNPVLVFALDRLVGTDLSAIKERVDSAGRSEQLALAGRLLSEWADADGQTLELDDQKLVLGVFAYEKLPMVQDLENSVDLLTGHPVVSAMAHDERAQSDLGRHSAPLEVDLDRVDPDDEHLVLDADPSQQAAIAAVLDGRNLIIQGPPGTGKSQTIANLLAEATARGQKVLFVAQKRAAIDAVVDNLRKSGLDDMVLDLHGGVTSKKSVIEQLGVSMDRAERQPSPDVSELNRRLTDRRMQLVRRSESMTRVREPYGCSIARLHEELAAVDSARDIGIRLPRTSLQHTSFDSLPLLSDQLARFVGDDGLRLWAGKSPWSLARKITERNDVQELQERLDALTSTDFAVRARRDLLNLLLANGFPRPRTVAEWGDVLTLMSAVSASYQNYGSELFDEGLDERRSAVATRAWRRENGPAVGFSRRRSLRKQLKRQRSAAASWPEVFEELSEAVRQRDLWAQWTSGRAPAAVDRVEAALSDYGGLRSSLAAIGAAVLGSDLALASEPDMDRHLSELKADENMLVRLPELNQQRHHFEKLGLAELLDRLADSQASPHEATESLRYAWISSALRSLRAEEPEYARFTAEAQERLIEEFRSADSEHIRRSTARVRRRLAEAQMHARDTWPEQRRVLRDQIGRKRVHKPLRELVAEASDLVLAVRPCWAMSPLVVSQVLPPRRLFDLVVFDEASQIEPADAIPSIARGRTVVVAGDSKQLPPTSFFNTAFTEGDEDVDEDGDLRQFSSILDALTRDLESVTLRWHYRSQDDRLIAFSNRAIYDGRLVTFPGTKRQSPVRHVLVDAVASPGRGGGAPSAEVERVIELAIEHAREHPEQSLGIITLGVSAQERVQRRLLEVLADRPDLEGFFAEGAVGRGFFVKNLESVQGDERDAIILSLGGSKTASGALNHRFGPINAEGGERRLNVAVTRSRRSMTVVSTFTHRDFDDAKVNSPGLRFLRDFVRFASGDTSQGESVDVESTPLEASIAERLEAAGIRTVRQHGTSSSRIALAVEHAEQPGRLVLAIEVDGASYHDPAHTIRERDRLRPDHLHRLGWRHHRVWAADWVRDSDSEVVRVIAELGSMARDSDTPVEFETPASEADVLVDPQPIRRIPWPRGLVPGLPIVDYPHETLVHLVRHLESDGLLRDRDQVVGEMMRALDFKKRGSRIVPALERALDDARRRRT